jgi:hypothetical protein
MTSASLVADNQKYSYPNSIYTFKFTTDMKIPQGGILEFTFDAAF